MIGSSQGNIIARYVIEACDLGEYKVHNYISISGPQNGVQKIPGCFTGEWCDMLNTIANNLALLNVTEQHVAPAAYYRETQNLVHYKWYLAQSEYLPYINNEKEHENSALYKKRFMSLNRIQLYLSD